jgi:hypothetical protein
MTPADLGRRAVATTDCADIRREHAEAMLTAIGDVLHNIAEDADCDEAADAEDILNGASDPWVGEDPRGALFVAADLLDLAGADLGSGGGWAHDLARELRRRALGWRPPVEAE